MEIPKATTQILIEQLSTEVPGLMGYRFGEETWGPNDFHRRIITLRNNRNQRVTIEIYLNGSLVDHKEAVLQALVEQDPSILDEPTA